MGTYKKTFQLAECSWHVNVLQRFIHASCDNSFHRYIQSTFINISFMNIYYVIILYFYYRTWIWCLFYSFFFNFTYQPHFLLPPLLPLPHLPTLYTPYLLLSGLKVFLGKLTTSGIPSWGRIKRLPCFKAKQNWLGMDFRKEAHSFSIGPGWTGRRRKGKNEGWEHEGSRRPNWGRDTERERE